MCLKTEALMEEIIGYLEQASETPTMLLIAQPAALELAADLRRLKQYIKKSGNYELGTKVAEKTSVFVVYLASTLSKVRHLVDDEKNKHIYYRTSDCFDKIASLDKDLNDWVNIQERMRNPGSSTIVDAEILEGMSKTKYACRLSETKLRHIFVSLLKQGYFSPETDVNDWLYICGRSKSPSNTIDWMKGQNELVYFIARMFGDDNENNVWAITSRLFTIRGVRQNPNTLRVVKSRSNIKKEKKDKIDDILSII